MGLVKESEEMFNKVTSSHSYDEALSILMEYIEPVEVSFQQEENRMQMK